MPAAHGLFDKAVPMSGAAHAVNPKTAHARLRADFCRELGVGDGDLAALRAASVDDLVAAQQRCERAPLGTPQRIGFRPNLTDGTFPERPIDAIRTGLSARVPVLVGATRDEWKLFGMMDPASRKLDAAGLDAAIEARVPGHGARIAAAYRTARPEATTVELFDAIETDRIFRIPAIRLAEAQSAHQPDTYAYLYTWESPILGGRLGACHGIDVPFVFGLIGTPGAEKFAGGGEDALRLQDQTTGAWLAFARDGRPGERSLPAWPRYETARRPTMLLGAASTLASDPFGAERAAWDEIL
jgi:para-nitrobenzyl esterase